MRDPKEIQDRMAKYEQMQEKCGHLGKLKAEARYAARVAELKWVLDNND